MTDALNPGQFYPPTAQHAIRQAAVLANNIVAAMRGPSPSAVQVQDHRPAGNHRTAPRRAEIFGWQFSGYLAWLLWRTIYLSKLPGLQKKARVALDWTLDLIFSKDLVQLPTLRSPTMSEEEQSSTGTAHKTESSKTEIRNSK